MNNDHPKVFISYSWEDDEHKTWVKNFADMLIADGIDATIDQYDLTLGDRIPHFMENSISKADYVLIICTPVYKQKSEARTGGVGYEGHIITGELLSFNNERKFIPIIRKGTISNSMPNWLSGKLAIDLAVEKHFQNNYQDLVTTIYTGRKGKPSLGIKPIYIHSTQKGTEKESVSNEDIKIMGIITDKVSIPKMDGTRGSALYRIPFRLSRYPSQLWSEIFVNTWDSPPSFTTMHRPRIARVIGDEIILDGTTIEEVRDYHRKTLMLCVDEANKKEREMIDKQRRIETAKKLQEDKHLNNVVNIADEIEF